MAKRQKKIKVPREPKVRPAIADTTDVIVAREEVLRKEEPPVTEKYPVGRTDQLVTRKE